MFDVVVIGAGAAGLMAATRLAERGKRTLVLEKNRKPGVKILISGGTRCNLTQNTDGAGIIRAFGRNGRFLHSALSMLGPQELVALIEAEGVRTKVEETGKIFPASDRALDVLNALMARLHRSGATLALGEALTEIEARESGFVLSTGSRTIEAERVLVTTGGKSYPGCGTVGDGYRWAEKFGHTIVAPRPALVPLVNSAPWVRALSGVTIPDVTLRVVKVCEEKGAKPQAAMERRGSLLFTHFGMSGPAALDVSREFSTRSDARDLRLQCDFLPNTRETQLEEQLRSLAASSGKKLLVGLMSEALPRRLMESIFANAEIPLERTPAELSRTERQRLMQSLKHTTLAIDATLGFEKAEVTAGGVNLDEVDSRSMQSLRVPGLYFAGEVLDLDGWIGGYNFQAAFSTGWLAAERME
ncbi:MAG TPA: NAD(P)/FAD-dependent oxidoreductase [Pirellulales bacterium]|nr:NAD(P)/FAD-dependent oxidoreductase [Pirellulales bacterium]